MKRWDIIQSLIDKYKLTSYLEIGVHQKECFNKIQCELKECVDPNFPADYEMTSDEFFKVVRGRWDICFVDGFHTEEQVGKDLVNAYVMAMAKFIVVHDCNPENEWATRPPEEYKRGEIWNGNVYKGFINFKKASPHLSCFTVDADYGCGIITELPLLKNKQPQFNGVWNGTWDEFDANRTELLGLKSVEEFKKLV